MHSAEEVIVLSVFMVIGLASLVFAPRVVEGYEGLLRRVRPWISWIAPYSDEDGLPLFWPWPELIRRRGLSMWYFRVSGIICVIIVLTVILNT